MATSESMQEILEENLKETCGRLVEAIKGNNPDNRGIFLVCTKDNGTVVDNGGDMGKELEAFGALSGNLELLGKAIKYVMSKDPGLASTIVSIADEFKDDMTYNILNRFNRAEEDDEIEE